MTLSRRADERHAQILDLGWRRVNVFHLPTRLVGLRTATKAPGVRIRRLATGTPRRITPSSRSAVAPARSTASVRRPTRRASDAGRRDENSDRCRHRTTGFLHPRALSASRERATAGRRVCGLEFLGLGPTWRQWTNGSNDPKSPSYTLLAGRSARAPLLQSRSEWSSPGFATAVGECWIRYIRACCASAS